MYISRRISSLDFMEMGLIQAMQIIMFCATEMEGMLWLKPWPSFTMRLFLFFRGHFFCILDVKDLNKPDALTSKIRAMAKFLR